MAPALGDGERAGSRDGTVVLEVGFVTDDDEGDALVVFDTDDLLAELVEFVEGAETCDGEDEEEALAGFHVEFSKGFEGALERRLFFTLPSKRKARQRGGGRGRGNLIAAKVLMSAKCASANGRNTAY